MPLERRRPSSDAAFKGRFDIIPACDRRTDGQTDGHTTTANTALLWRRAVKWQMTYETFLWCVWTKRFSGMISRTRQYARRI